MYFLTARLSTPALNSYGGLAPIFPPVPIRLKTPYFTSVHCGLCDASLLVAGILVANDAGAFLFCPGLINSNLLG